MRERDSSQRKEGILLLAHRITELPSVQQKVLAMYYVENLQLAEIAAHLGLRFLQTNLFRDLAQTKSLDWTSFDTFGSRSPHPWLDG
jgi:hypothetical protein